MKKYILALKQKEDKEGIKQEISSLSSLQFVPNRECTTEDIEDTRCLYLYLTEEEAKELKKDPRIKNLGPKQTTIIMPMLFPGNNIFTPRLNSPTIIDTKNKVELKQKIENKVELQQIQTQALNQYAVIKNLPSGLGVDVVIVDGIISGRMGVEYRIGFGNRHKIYFDGVHHPELLDEQGNSRINLLNWNDYISQPGENGQYPYEELMKNVSQLSNNLHGIHVAGIACGLTIGWAKNSSIYNISPYYGGSIMMQDYNFLRVIKNWHNFKGNSRPTIANNSYGVTSYPFDIRYVSSVTLGGVRHNAPRQDQGAVVQCALTNGYISSFSIINGGSGYTNTPTISFNGGGGDEAILHMGDGSIKEIIVTNIGSGYDMSNPPTITFSQPTTGVRATGTCIVDGQGRISKIIMSHRGLGYTQIPNVVFSSPGPGGQMAEAEVVISSGFVTRIQVINSVPVTYIPGYEAAQLHHRGSSVTEGGRDIPILIISGGECQKEALYTFSDDVSILSDWYGDVNSPKQPGKITDGLYVIAETKTNLSPVSFKQTLLGGEYLSTPSVSFTYTQGGSPTIGPNAIIHIENENIKSIDPLWVFDNSFGAVVDGEQVGLSVGGWFTTAPQVFLTNGGGFTPSQIESWGFNNWLTLPFAESPTEMGPERPAWEKRLGAEPVRRWVGFHGARDILMDTIVEDMIDSGIIFVAAAGNSSSEVRTQEHSGDSFMEVNYGYLNKANPSILYEDNIPFPQFPNSEIYVWPPTQYLPCCGQTFRSAWGPSSPYLWGDIIDTKNLWEGPSPGAAPGAVCVGSTSWNCCPEKKAAYSNTGTRIDIYAAGDQIVSCNYDNISYKQAGSVSNPIEYQDLLQNSVLHPKDNRFGLWKFSGTSMASPQVCGAIACALTDGYLHAPTSLSQESITNWLKQNGKISLSDVPYPSNLAGGTDKQLYFPGVDVIVSSI